MNTHVYNTVISLNNETINLLPVWINFWGTIFSSKNEEQHSYVDTLASTLASTLAFTTQST